MNSTFPPILIVDTIDSNIRVSKYLTEKGICSRREADEWILKNWVRIDNVNALLGQRIYSNQKIDISPIAFINQAKAMTFLLNKPLGYVSSQAEDGHRTARSLLTIENQHQTQTNQVKSNEAYLKKLYGLAPAGRLDIDSTGLLVLTQNGRLAKYLIGENSKIEKEYLVRVSPNKDREHSATHIPPNILDKLRNGLFLDGVRLKPAKVDWKNDQQLRIILNEGKKRQIRRMCEQVGLKVTALKRIRIGKIELGNLPIGKWRFLQKNETF